jgi:hypothetical protein
MRGIWPERRLGIRQPREVPTLETGYPWDYTFGSVEWSDPVSP